VMQTWWLLPLSSAAAAAAAAATVDAVFAAALRPLTVA